LPEIIGEHEPEEIEKFCTRKNLSSIPGGEKFKVWIGDRFSDLRFNREPPESKTKAKRRSDPISIFRYLKHLTTNLLMRFDNRVVALFPDKVRYRLGVRFSHLFFFLSVFAISQPR
jgi:hypothetical protein